MFIIGIIFGIVWVVICYYIAEEMGWDKLGAVILGILFGLFAVIGYAIARSSVKAKQKKQESVSP
jgi:hypothetical protein